MELHFWSTLWRRRLINMIIIFATIALVLFIFLLCSLTIMQEFPRSSHFSLTKSTIYNDFPIHLSQHRSHDCGFACIRMVTAWIGIIDVIGFVGDPLKPSWTIELFNCLSMNGVNAEFYTKTCGISHHHYELEWYSSYLAEDADQINIQFQMAYRNRWPIHKVLELFIRL